MSNASAHGDPFELRRFTDAQERVYERVVDELRDGRKRSHWMWFIFPQVEGLGFSATSQKYSIKGIEEARQYLEHPVLGKRLSECAGLVLAVEGRSASEIFGYPDDMKLRSSMTLFAAVSGPDSVFVRILEKYFHSEPDAKTLRILEGMRKE